MQPEQQRRLSQTHENLWVLKNRPYTHSLQGTEVTYSILNKKQKTFVLSHERFLYLNGIESISYASTSPPEAALPLKDTTALPKFKTTFPLSKIKTVVTVNQNLIIQFSGQGNPKWEFVCPTKDCAKAWKQKIQSTLKALKEMIDGKFATYADYLKHKQSQPPIQGNNIVPPLNPNGNVPPVNIPQNINNPNNPNQPISPNKPVINNPPSPQKKLHPLVFNDQLNKTNTPIVATFNGPVLYPNIFMTEILKPVIPQPSNIDKLLKQIDGLRRNWLQEWVQGENEQQLILSFRNYTQKVAEVIILELPTQKDKRIPAHEFTKQFASYLFKDIHVQIYFVNQENLYSKHERYQKALKEFKNLDHLVSSTRNIGPLRAPLMVMFEYKGILGMTKTRVADNVPFRNRQLYQILDHRLFQDETKISTEVFLNESKAKIVKYEGRLPPQNNQVYIIERLSEFLPSENEQFSDSNSVLRPEFVHDEDLEYLQNVIFRDRKNPVRLEAVLNELESKVKYFVSVIEEEDEYFTNSKELAQLFHFYGLNMRHLGLVLRHSTKNWLKRIIRSQIVSRSLKNHLRVQLQRSVNQNTSQNDSRQRRKVIDLLNVFLGNTDNTNRLWNNLNSYSKKYFNAPIWSNNFNDFNIPYLLQALQSNLSIVLQQNILLKQPFKSSQTLQESDIIGFEFNTRIFDLQFTDSFQVINESLLDQSPQSFHDLCQLLTSQNNRRNVQLIKILETHPIHLKIYEYLLNFTSPDQSIELYNKAQASYRPNRFLYEAKLAQIKWYLKADRQDKVVQAVNFFTEHVKRWLGDVHPLLTQVHRHLAEYFCQIRFYYDKALRAAIDSLSMQLALFQGDHFCLWRDYFLVGKIYFLSKNLQQTLKYLIKAKQLAKVNDQNDYYGYGQLCLMLAKSYKATRLFKEAYTTIKQFFEIIKNQTDEQSIAFILEAAFMIQNLLQMSQQHQLFLKFLQSDFLNVITLLLNQYRYLPQIIKISTIPYLKNVVLQKSKHRGSLLQIITQISRIKQQSGSGQQYLKIKIRHGKFPREYFNILRDLDSIIQEINNNEILQKWISYNRIAGYNLVHMVGDGPINRSFQFLCYLSALFNYLGNQILGEITH